MQDAAFVQGMLQTIMSLLCRTLRLTMVESQILKVSRCTPHVQALSGKLAVYCGCNVGSTGVNIAYV